MKLGDLDKTTRQIYEDPGQRFIEGSAQVSPDLGGALRILEKRTLANFPDGETLTFLDLGCGAGREMPELQYIFGGRVVGVDYSNFLLSRAKQLFTTGEIRFERGEGDDVEVVDATPKAARPYLETMDQSRLHLAQSDVRVLPFPDELVEAAQSNCVLLHMGEENARSALEEASRVLKPEGTLLVRYKTPADSHEFVSEGVSTGVRRDGRKYWYYEPKKMTEMMEDAGFEVVYEKVEPVRENIEFIATSRFAVVIGEKDLGLEI